MSTVVPFELRVHSCFVDMAVLAPRTNESIASLGSRRTLDPDAIDGAMAGDIFLSEGHVKVVDSLLQKNSHHSPMSGH